MQKIRAFQVYQCAYETWLKCLEAGCDQFFFHALLLTELPDPGLSLKVDIYHVFYHRPFKTHIRNTEKVILFYYSLFLFSGN